MTFISLREQVESAFIRVIRGKPVADLQFFGVSWRVVRFPEML